MFGKLKNIFNKKENSSADIQFDKNVFLDEEFASKFVAHGGIFSYVESQSHALSVLQKIAEAEQLDCITTFENELKNDITVISNTLFSDEVQMQKHTAMYITCEGLISYDGSILISSDQIKQFKLDQLPKNIIVKANTNQFLKNASQGLESIRRTKYNQIPSNITSIKGSVGNEITRENFVKKIFLIVIETEQ